MFHSFAHSLFHPDTYYTLHRRKSNRWSRSTTSRQCSTTKPGDIYLFHLFNLSFILYYFTQTLITLYVARNQITDEGAKYFADALQQNRVTSTHLVFLIFHLFSVPHRHWSHLASNEMKLVIKERTILQMHFVKTKYYILLSFHCFHSNIHSLFHTDIEHAES